MNFTSISDFLNLKTKPTKQILFVVFLLFINIIIFYSSIHFFNKRSKEALLPYNIKDSVMLAAIHKDTVRSPYVHTLKDLYLASNGMRRTYHDLSRGYHVHGIAYSISLFYCTIMLGIFSFLVIKRGWDNTDHVFYKIAFLYFSATATLFGMLPKVFKNSENIAKNFEKAKCHFSLQLDIYHLVKDTKGYFAKNQTDSIKENIFVISDKIKNNQDLFFGVSEEAIPTKLNLSENDMNQFGSQLLNGN